MASLIYQGVGTSKGREDEQVSELAMRADQFPSIEQSNSDGLTTIQVDGSAARPASTPTLERVYRHRLPVRISHWLNVPLLIILIMSGLQIFNGHPALYWNDRSDREHPFLSIRPMKTENAEMRGITTIMGYKFDTTGVLGYSDGKRRAFPAWATIPSAKVLAMGRQWHLFFAWLLVINGLFFTAYDQSACHTRLGSER
jgi:thiosulfate reductase cytochrome b subunit